MGNYYCNKCGSDAVVVESVEPEVKKEDSRVSIDDFNGFPVTATLAYRLKVYRAVCKNCGHSKTITQ